MNYPLSIAYYVSQNPVTGSWIGQLEIEYHDSQLMLQKWESWTANSLRADVLLSVKDEIEDDALALSLLSNSEWKIFWHQVKCESAKNRSTGWFYLTGSWANKVCTLYNMSGILGTGSDPLHRIIKPLRSECKADTASAPALSPVDLLDLIPF